MCSKYLTQKKRQGSHFVLNNKSLELLNYFLAATLNNNSDKEGKKKKRTVKQHLLLASSCSLHFIEDKCC